jgi:uncharacterized protein
MIEFLKESASGTLFSVDDGKIFVASARESISTYLDQQIVKISGALLADLKYSQKLGCFVTLRDAQNSLRGCIGFPEPTYQLSKSLTQAAIYAATDDPRFPTVNKKELDQLTIEVSVLTPPRNIGAKDPREYLEKVVIGKHGLILKWPYGSGLLLPQVPVEEKWNVEEYLSNLSMKAGAMPDQWLLPETQIQSFEAEVFEEIQPGGQVLAKL